ncbi:MAG: hypothetical protein ABJH28_09230 [Paraglaciecola sp.]|uniref:hypothetical protein n=1 Tax=Paraglaciecola sp. TaxID=1920173 RepID=UPI003267F00A
MKHFSISKFENRDDESWTSFSDIGKEIDNEVLTYDSYFNTESSYLNFASQLLELLDMEASDFHIKSLEDNRGQYSEKSLYAGIEFPRLKLCGGDNLTNSELFSLIRLCLRDLMWLRLESMYGDYITFGHDFHMHVGVTKEINLDKLNFSKSKLYIVPCDEDPH